MNTDRNAAKELFLKGIAAIDDNMFAEAELFFLQTLERVPGHIGALNNLAVSQFRQSKFEAAAETARQIIAAEPVDLDALLVLASCQKTMADYGEAIEIYDRIIGLDAQNAIAHFNRSHTLMLVGRFEDALSSFDTTIRLSGDSSAAWLHRSHCLMNLNRYAEAVESYDKTLALDPNELSAWLARGHACMEIKRYDEALVSFDRAVLLNPHLESSLLGRGDALVELRRYEEAWRDYKQVATANPDSKFAWLGCGNASALGKNFDRALEEFDYALTLDPALESAWLGRGNIFTEQKQYDEGLAAYSKALALNPRLANAFLGRGNILVALQKYDDAFAAFEQSLALDPNLAKAWIGIGNVKFARKRFYDALTAFDRALSINANAEIAWIGRGNALTELARNQEAFAAFDKAFSINPHFPTIEGARLQAKLQLCDWSNFEMERERLEHRLLGGQVNAAPFNVICLGGSAELQLQYARRWTQKEHPPSDLPIWRGDRYSHDKIRIAYLSPDFGHHPVSYLLAGVLEAHDETTFEITGIAFSPDDKSGMRARIEKSCDAFIDVTDKSDLEVAELLRQREMDIAIDLAGFTLNARTGVLAHRPCPIQVNYLGYPGTLGASYIDYLIADPTLIPASAEQFYAEKIAFLPHTYLPSDTLNRPSLNRQSRRSEFGLPEDGFVFCCFNNAYKLTPDVFGAWMDILHEISDGVLWLSELNVTASTNLKKAAAAANIDPSRLIFAKRLPSAAEHLARHRLADLFLDTWPYNAHTTASDALWAGLPVLTKIGETFAGRVAASLLNVAGLKNLIAANTEDYKKIAIQIATNPLELQAIKNKLRDDHAETPLFDTQLFARNLERLYQAMYARHQQGLSLERIVLSDEPNKWLN